MQENFLKVCWCITGLDDLVCCVCRLHFLYWMLLMASLTCALVLAASQVDPRRYSQDVDVFRGICEGLSLLLLVLATLSEIYLIFV